MDLRTCLVFAIHIILLRNKLVGKELDDLAVSHLFVVVWVYDPKKSIDVVLWIVVVLNDDAHV